MCVFVSFVTCANCQVHALDNVDTLVNKFHHASKWKCSEIFLSALFHLLVPFWGTLNWIFFSYTFSSLGHHTCQLGRKKKHGQNKPSIQHVRKVSERLSLSKLS